MSTHAGAMLIAAFAYTFARKHASDPRFVFGTGKLGDLAGFTSAIILAMIALLIGYEAIARLLSPVRIHFGEAIPIAVVGLLVNILSAWLLSGHDHPGHDHGHGHGGHGETEDGMEGGTFSTPAGEWVLSIFEDGVPPVFRIRTVAAASEPLGGEVLVTTTRPDGTRQVFTFSRKAGFLEATAAIPEPHAFTAVVTFPGGEQTVLFQEPDHGHGVGDRDNNMRAAYIHVMADAAVSVLAIIGLLLAKVFGWLWMDPLAGIVGALVIANWSYSLICVTGAILMDISPDDKLAGKVRAAVEAAGDHLVDLHVWRLGPGHFGAVASVVTREEQRGPGFYHAVLRPIKGLSHITVEVNTLRQPAG
jgi:cation diffusion facilitator family transporter